MKKFFNRKVKSINTLVSVILAVIMVFTIIAVPVAAENNALIVFIKDSMINNKNNYEMTTFHYWNVFDSRLCAAHIDATEDEIIEVARVLEHESCGFGNEGRYLVATIIANRVVSNSYPNTIWDVVMQQGQFGNGKGEYPCDECISAAKDVFYTDTRALPAYVLNFQSIRADYWQTLGFECYAQIEKGIYTEYFCFDPEYKNELIKKYMV